MREQKPTFMTELTSPLARKERGKEKKKKKRKALAMGRLRPARVLRGLISVE